jgi:16S rRNA (cytidine1402-2'-O)-methyltransferase
VEALLQQIQEDTNQQRGEFVLLVKGVDKLVVERGVVSAEAEALMTILLEYTPVKTASAIAAKVTGIKKRDLYQWALANPKNS